MITVRHYTDLGFLAGGIERARVLYDEVIVKDVRSPSPLARSIYRAGIYVRIHRAWGPYDDAWDRQMCQDDCPHAKGEDPLAAPIEPHSCPYAHDLYDDKLTTCTCCETCKGFCCDEI